MNAIASKLAGKSEEGWKAIVLYSDAQSGANAQKLLCRVAQRADSGDAWQTNFWRFDVMAEQHVANLALHDAQDAQLVFLSAGSISTPPHWLAEWFRAWSHERRGKASAVAAWCQHPPEGKGREAMELLRRITLEQGMTFLCADDYTAEMGE